MSDTTALALVQRLSQDISKSWAEIRTETPSNNDLVCIVLQNGADGDVTIKIGPRVDYVEWLKSHEDTSGPVKTLSVAAGDAEPKLSKELAMWVVVPVSDGGNPGISILRITVEPRVTSKGGSA